MILGIDIGTEFSDAAVLVNGKFVKLCTADSMYSSFASAAYAGESGLEIGNIAVSEGLNNPLRYISGFKNDIGVKQQYDTEGSQVTPLQIYTEYFKYYKNYAEEMFGEAVLRSRITYPAIFTQEQRSMLIQATCGAGLPDAELVEEGCAAAQYYAHLYGIQDGEKIVVYDFGAGPFCAYLIEKADGKFNTIASVSHEKIGGQEFDSLIYDELVKRFGTAADVKPALEMPAARMLLMRECRRVKHLLSSAEQARAYLPTGPAQVQSRVLSRVDFNMMVGARIWKTVRLVEGLARDNALTFKQVDKVICVGGCTNIPYVIEILERAYGRRVLRLPDTKLASCCGSILSAISPEEMCDTESSYAAPPIAAPHEILAEDELVIDPGVDIAPDEALPDEKNSTDPESQFKLGMLYMKGQGVPQDFETAAGWFDKAAKQGHTVSQYMLAHIYETGRGGVAQNEQEAYNLYQSAAKSGHSASIYMQGAMLFDGRGVEQDKKAAAECFQRAVDLGLMQARYKLGTMYETGDGVEQNTSKATELLRKAAENGHAGAQCSMGNICVNILRNYRLAAEWYRQSADQGNVEAEYHLGMMYMDGQGISHRPDRGVELLRKAADLGNADAQIRLAIAYCDGDGVVRDDVKAFELMRSAAEQGIVEAQCRLGRFYNEGRGVKKDEQQAIVWVKKAADSGHVEALYLLGAFYAKSSEHVGEAAQLLQIASDQLHVGAQVLLGALYEDGIGVEKDMHKAVELYAAAGRAQSPEACYKLGKLYEDGAGVEQSDARAIEWYQRASKLGNPQAYYNLARMCEDGRGMERDDKKMVEWYHKATELGDARAQRRMGEIYLSGKGAPRNIEAAVQLFKSAAQQGDVEAQFALGSLYLKGTGVDKNIQRASAWLMKAAAQNHVSAQLLLGSMYRDGIGLGHDPHKAFDWYLKAAEQGHAEAQYHIAQMYDTGECVEQDDKQAFEWYLKAAEQGYGDAQVKIAGFYEQGRGTQVDSTQALKWYRLAAQKGQN